MVWIVAADGCNYRMSLLQVKVLLGPCLAKSRGCVAFAAPRDGQDVELTESR
jgi:hypothetical protein